MQPACGAFPGQGNVTGFQGRRLVNSKNRNLGTLIGELQSQVFTIAGGGIDFLIGGGDFDGVTCLNLYVQGDGGWQRERTATGERNLQLVRRGWDVAEFRGRQACLQILDYAAVEPWGWHAAPRYPEDDWGFILADDIRQTDGAANPRRIDEAGDRARNFDFETLLPERFTVTAVPAASADGGGGVFEIHDREQGRVVGALHCTAAVTRRPTGPGAGDRDRGGTNLWHVAFTWRYQGETLSGVKLRLTSRLPVAAADASYTLHPGLLYDGNPTAEACHYLGEDLPEAAATVPAGFSVEDAAWVFAGWVEPQRRAADPAASVRLQVDPTSGRYEAVHQLPESAVFGRRLLLDSDERLTLSDGACYRKTLYLYAAAPPRRHRVPPRLLRRSDGGMAPALPGLADQSPAQPARRLRTAPAHHARRPRADPGDRARRAHLPRVLRRALDLRRCADRRRTVPAQGVFPPLRRLLLVRHGGAGGARGARLRPAA